MFRLSLDSVINRGIWAEKVASPGKFNGITCGVYKKHFKNCFHLNLSATTFIFSSTAILVNWILAFNASVN